MDRKKELELLDSFTDYMIKHEGERFWQALRNWSGNNFIFVSKFAFHELFPSLQDTFYWKEVKSILEKEKVNK